MIDPANVTKFDRTQEELEEFLVFCTLSANNTATRAARQTSDLLLARFPNETPLQYLWHAVRENYLMWVLTARKIGPYRSRFLTLTELAMGVAGPSVLDMTVETLERVYGIGPKTARFFILHSQEDAEYAVLDTHILKHLAWVLEVPNVPKLTPQDPRRYRQLEQIFLDDARERGRTPAEHDTAVWQMFRRREVA